MYTHNGSLSKGKGNKMANKYNILENFSRAARRQKTENTPVAFCLSTAYICDLFKIDMKDYYHNVELKMKTQCAFQDKYPEVVLFPGIHPDYSCGAVEPSAFGCEIVQSTSLHPLCPKARIKNASDISTIKEPNPRTDGLLPQIIKEYEYFWKNLDRKYIDTYGYLDGFGFLTGPTETAALVAGYENFCMEIVDNPKRIHGLLEVTTSFAIKWLKEQEKINGKLKRIYCLEHMPARLSAAHTEEFVTPYLNRVLGEFGYAVRMFHICDLNIEHVLKAISGFKADIFHFAPDVRKVKSIFQDKMCLMGNLHTINLLRKANVGEVTAAADECIRVAGQSGGFILAPHGAFVPGTPEENIRAIAEYANRPALRFG